MTIWNLLKKKIEDDYPEGLATTTDLVGEATRAKAAEKTNEEAISGVSGSLTTEVSRAKAAEKVNTEAVETEVTRAKAAEKVNSEATTSATAAAKTRETEAQEKAEEKSKAAAKSEVTAEASTRASADTANKSLGEEANSSIATEVTRAKAGEKSAEEAAVANAASKDATEIARAKAAEKAAEEASIPLTQKGANNGVAELDGTGKVPTGQIPALEVGETFVVANQAAQEALTGVSKGDFVFRTDNGFLYIHNGGTAKTMADYNKVESGGAVGSVNSKTGAVTLNYEDVGADKAGLAAAAETAAIANAAGKDATEVARAKAAEKVLEEGDTAEVARAKAAEKVLQEEFVAEEVRALAAEKAAEEGAIAAAATKDSAATTAAKAREKEAEEKAETKAKEAAKAEIESEKTAAKAREKTAKEEAEANALAGAKTKDETIEAAAIAAAAAKDTTLIAEAKTREKEAQEKAEEKSKSAAKGEVEAEKTARESAETAFVKLTEAQTVAGVKTFSSSPIVPNATTAKQAVTKEQLEAAEALKKKNITSHTWAWEGALSEGKKARHHIRVDSGETQKVIGIEYEIEEGTEAKFELTRSTGGGAASGMTELTALVIDKTVRRLILATPLTLSSEDYLQPKIGTLTGAPTKGSITVFVRHES